MKYKFYTKRIKQKTPKIERYPCLVLNETSEKDNQYQTQFVLYFYESSRKKTEVGLIKILERNEFITRLPDSFYKLPSKYCSLGQSNFFYTKLYHILDRKNNFSILKSLNDITQVKAIYKSFQKEDGLKNSLMRFSEAQKAFNEVPLLMAGKKVKNSFHFQFTTHIPSFVSPHKAFFSFNKKSPLPKRIAAIIGKNGSGKTQYLARLATSLSGLSENGFFNTRKIPPFSRVLAISYSLFDRFEQPRSTKSFSYIFCGFQSEKEFDSVFGLERRLNRALRQIKNNERLDELRQYLSILVGEELANKYTEQISFKRKQLRLFFDERYYTTLSSGQIMMIVIMTEIMAYLTTESILLFDEPETHLHPNAISNLVGVIYEIVKKHDSFAIIATHSPQIVQEIPSSLIFYFDFDKSNPPVNPMPIETFGENLTTLTEKIFNTQNVDENYKKIIKDLFKKYSKEEIINILEKKALPLSMNARVFIEYLSKQQ